MADFSDVKEERYEYNGSQPFLVSQTLQTRTGYRGRRQYNKLGELRAHAVGYLKSQKICRNRKSSTSGSPVSPVSFQQPEYFIGRQRISRTAVRNDATRKFYQELANTNALLPLMLKERQQTIDMVTEKVMKLVAIKRNFLREMRKSWKGNDHRIVQNRWLEYRYGWLPTIMDIDTLINKPLGNPHAKVSGFAMVRYDDHGYKIGEEELDQNGALLYKVQSIVIPKDPFMKTASQYGIANPGLVLWEMVPYSFVVDWVFDVGGYLEHLGALNGLELVDPITSELHEFFQQSYAPPRSGLTSSYGSYKGKIGGRSLGVPSYPNPFIPNNGMNLTRFLDAAALLKGQFDRFRR